MTRKTPLSADEVFDFATGFIQESVAANRSVVYPTMREAAAHFHVNLNDLEDAIESGTSKGYLGVAVALLTGAGIGCLEPKGSCYIEAYE